MCGIVAHLRLHDSQPNPRLIREMAREIDHRGPDDEGFFESDWISLGFKRLSILDLSSAGHQPLLCPQHRFVLVFNGEVYNFQALKSELQAKGHVFTSTSDSEVVLYALIEWGPAALEKFRGMFALIFLDTLKNEALIARDHMGVKPLYFLRTPNNLYFSSEVKSFKHCTDFRLNEKVLWEQFHFRSVAGENTLFHDVFRVQPGTYMKIGKSGILKTTRYFDLAETYPERFESNVDMAEVESRLEGSIRLHTVSDVGYNIQLSGGIDSSYITAVLSRASSSTLRTYSVELEDPAHDESHYQKIVVSKFKNDHTSIRIGNERYTELFKKATWYMDFPIVHSACPMLMELCSLSRKTSKVILTGEGADELFLGYSRYNLSFRENLAHHLYMRNISPSFIPNLPWFRGIRSQMHRDNSLESASQSELLDKIVTTPKSHEFRNEVVSSRKDLITRMSLTDQNCYLATLLERQDKMSMSQSVESRVPFVNPDLFTYINRISPSVKSKPIPKSLLKKLSESYFDQPFIYRKKKGFSLPLRDWFKDPRGMGSYLELLRDTTFKTRGFYNYKTVDRLLDDHISGKRDRYRELFLLTSFEVWHRTFIDKHASL